MRFSWAATALFALPSVLAAGSKGQFPVIDGVIGGIRNNTRVQEEAVLASKKTTPGKLRVVENSGICETTKGVYQASGYGDLTSKESIFFWYFDARNNASSAPLTLWFNGGPGSSSMLGLFQELGPCRITNNSESVTLNPYSWNTNSNLLVIDQPVGAGFSHGTSTVGTSLEAASDIWKFIQIFLADSRFAHLANVDLAIWTESYGGHYGPTFASYFLSQNEAIANGTATGVTLNLKTLAIGNGLTDPISQYPGYISYATSNPYGALVSSSTIKTATNAWSSSKGCEAQIKACNNGGSNSVCSSAQSYCNNNILSALIGDHDVYYVLSGSDDPYPPDITSYLGGIQSKIGAEVTWQMTSDTVYNNFAETGDWMRTVLPLLDAVVDAGIRVHLYNGDADFIVNYQGVEDMMATMSNKYSSEFNKQSFGTYTVGGKDAGEYKNAGGFSYLRVTLSGHQVPAYQNVRTGLAFGEAAFQMFTQVMSGGELVST
ncbi:Carboxypeptidase [Mycena chlorophos]|uniref:Carboxypeptidase n=1 Tax=Mycena chlorophos TaxID=658473 RepID=A0A8H6T1S9_MYCCL|nr:Carboxypeptidase [Mycena chlorophos]